MLKVYFILMSLFAFLPTLVVAQSPAEASEAKLTKLKSELPKILEEAWLPKLVEKKPEGEEHFYTKIGIFRMTSDNTAKISLEGNYCHRSEAPSQNLDVVVILELKYYKGAWTVSKHEAHESFRDGRGRPELLRLINNIDKFSN